jgi:hypothetical protein
MSTSSSEHTSPSEEASAQNGVLARGGTGEEEISFLDVLLVLVQGRWLIVGFVIAFTVAGLAFALLTPERYTAGAKVVRETNEETPQFSGGGLSALQGLGISLGGTSGGLGRAAYPEVLKGHNVRIAVIRDTFSFPDSDRPMTLIEHTNQPGGIFSTVWKYTLGLPWTVKGMLYPESPSTATGDGEMPALTEDEYRALRRVSGMVSTRVNDDTGLMTISVTASGPRLAAQVTESFLEHLTERVREIRTEKVRNQLDFVETRFQQAGEELEETEKQLAQFLERNQGAGSAQLQFQRDRLQRQVRFKEQLYSNLQSQLTQTRLDLQRQQPVLTIVEEPVPPVEESWPNRTFIVILSVVVGGSLGVAASFGQAYLDEFEENEKMKQVREELTSMNPISKPKGEKKSE